jgi:hypothetical protein
MLNNNLIFSSIQGNFRIGLLLFHFQILVHPHRGLSVMTLFDLTADDV